MEVLWKTMLVARLPFPYYETHPTLLPPTTTILHVCFMKTRNTHEKLHKHHTSPSLFSDDQVQLPIDFRHSFYHFPQGLLTLHPVIHLLLHVLPHRINHRTIRLVGTTPWQRARPDASTPFNDFLFRSRPRSLLFAKHIHQRRKSPSDLRAAFFEGLFLGF